MIPLGFGGNATCFFRAGFMDFKEEPTSSMLGTSSTTTMGSFWDILSSWRFQSQGLLTQGKNGIAKFMPVLRISQWAGFIGAFAKGGENAGLFCNRAAFLKITPYLSKGYCSDGTFVPNNRAHDLGNFDSLSAIFEQTAGIVFNPRGCPGGVWKKRRFA
jgi:hypothetical protein